MSVSAPNSRQKGLKAAMLETYTATGNELPAWIDNMFFQDSTDGAFEDYIIPREQPTLKVFRDGDPISEGSMTDISHRVVVSRWGSSLEWSELDERYNRSPKSLRARAQDLGEDAGLWKERVAIALLNGTVSEDSIDEQPLAFDGYSLFSVNHAEHQYGNLVGFQDRDDDEREFIENLITLGVGRYRRMTKPVNNQKLFSDGEIARARWHLLHPPEKETLIIDALKARYQFRNNTAGDAAAAPENALAGEYGARIIPHVWQRMSADDGYFLIMELPGSSRKKPFIELTPQASGLQFHYYNKNNDGDARRYRREGLDVELNRGFGIKDHFMAVHLDTGTAVQS